MNDTYKIITKTAEGIYKEKGSKFLSFAIPVKNTDEIKEILKEYRKKYFDARHICYAYMLGYERNEFRANDDGEPSGTAGKPILGQINSKELTNILVIVVRYFGGILLGTGGLVTAYKEATIDALQNAEIVEYNVEKLISILFKYEQTNSVLKIIKEDDLTITDKIYDEACVISVLIPLLKYDKIKGKLMKLGYDLKFHD